MVLPILAGAGLLAGGTLLGMDAADRREDALSGVAAGRQGAVEGFNQTRQNLLSDAVAQLPQFQQQQQDFMGTAIEGLGQRGGTIAGATDAGRQRIMSNIQGMDFSSATPGTGGLNTGGGARAAMAAGGAPLAQALQGLAASRMGEVAGQRQTGDVMRGLSLAKTGLGRDLQGFQGDLSLAQANVGLQDLLNSLFTNQQLQQASQVGGRSEAFGGLMQQLGGGFLGAGLQGAFG